MRGQNKIRVRRNDKEGSAGYPILDGIKNDNNNLSSYGGRSELMLILVGV